MELMSYRKELRTNCFIRFLNRVAGENFEFRDLFGMLVYLDAFSDYVEVELILTTNKGDTNIAFNRISLGHPSNLILGDLVIDYSIIKSLYYNRNILHISLKTDM